MNLAHYLGLCCEEAARSLWFHRNVVAPALLVMIVSLTVLGAFVLVSENLNDLLTSWRERGQLQVFILPEADEADRARIETELRGTLAVEDFHYVSSEEAADLFRADFAELGEVLGLLEDNPLPASYAVTIAPAMRSERVLEQLSGQLADLPMVEGVQYDLQIIGRLEIGVWALRFVGVLLGGTVLMAAVITTANVIRVLVVTRRREVETMRLVGASESIVVGRFLAEGALQGLIAGVVSVVVLYVVYSVGLAYLDRESLGFLAELPLRFLGVAWILSLVIGGTATGVAGSWLAFGPGGVRSEV
ncbi:MAG TPA: permease-like cell division protein FtsX [Acidobacteriota bacterium]|nr:permease-like cell division protein FtsX [Acidobacteriota bacterium]